MSGAGHSQSGSCAWPTNVGSGLAGMWECCSCAAGWPLGRPELLHLFGPPGLLLPVRVPVHRRQESGSPGAK